MRVKHQSSNSSADMRRLLPTRCGGTPHEMDDYR